MDSVAETRFRAGLDTSAGPDACWPWTRGHDGGGYGMFHVDGRVDRTHRIAYRLAFGSIPDGFTIDHLCRNRGCGNPRHLEAVTHSENVRRGAPFRRKEFCIRGHRLADTRNKQGNCQSCVTLAHLRWYHRTKQLKGRLHTICRNGHPLSGDNLTVLSGGQRKCVTCARARSRRWRAKQR